MRCGPIRPISRSRMFSRLSSIRMVNTTTARAVPTGFTNGSIHSRSAASAVGGVSATAIGAAPGAASFSSSLIASAALPRLPSCGSRTARIFLLMLARYSGSLAASESAWLVATAPLAAIAATAMVTAMRVEKTRPNRQCSSRRTTGASRKDSRIARASGISTSRARYRMAAAISSPKSEEVLLVVEGKQQQRAARDLVLVADWEGRLVRGVREVGVGDERPSAAAVLLRQLEFHHVLPGIEDDEQRRFLAALADAGGLRAPVEQHAEAARVGILPLLLAHLLAGGVDPAHVLDAEVLVEIAVEEARAPQDREAVAQPGQLAHEVDQALGAVVVVPVDPADLVVLAVGIVVAVLRARELVAGQQHRRALRQEQRGEHVLHLALAQRANRLVDVRALGAVVPRAVVRVAILVVLAVRLVVLVVVGDEVVQREAVVGGDEIDAGPRLSAAAVEDVGRAAQPRRQGRRRRFGTPVVAHRVAVLVVPLRPARRKAADLVAARAAVPRLGDQLHLGEPRILHHRLHEAVVRVEAAGLAREDGAQVEAEAVDVHLLGPVAQAVAHHLDHQRIDRKSGV